MSKPMNGQSLMYDAWLRFRKNRLAMVGFGLVLLVGVLGLFAPLVAQYVTHFSYDEQHTEFRLMPPGARDISIDYPSYDGNKDQFSSLDLNQDERIGGNGELRQLYWINRFFLFVFNDYDVAHQNEPITEAHRRGLSGVHPDGRLEKRELPEKYADLNSTFQTEFSAFVRARLSEKEKADYQRVKTASATAFEELGLGRDQVFTAVDTNRDGTLSEPEVNAYRRKFRPFENTEQVLIDFDANKDGAISLSEYPGVPVEYTFWLGTDHLGRDVLTRVLYGARISITIALLATFVSFVIGVTWGAIAGYYGGKVDSVMMRIVDVMYGLPFMFIVILLIVVFGRSTLNLFIALGAVQWLTMSRIVRGQIISLKTREFVEAARAIGVPRIKIVFRHLLRNTIGPVIVYSTLMVPAVILEEAFLSFLGLGVQPPFPSWGNMITDGATVMESYPWLIIFPGAVLGITLFSMNFIGDGIRDALDPQNQQG